MSYFIILERQNFMVYFKKTLIKVDRASMVHGLEVKVPFKEKLLDPSFYGTMGFDEYEIEKMLSHHILNKKDYK